MALRGAARRVRRRQWEASGSATHGRPLGRASRLCIAGPVRVAVGRDDGRRISVRTCVGGEWSASRPRPTLASVSPRRKRRAISCDRSRRSAGATLTRRCAAPRSPTRRHRARARAPRARRERADRRAQASALLVRPERSRRREISSACTTARTPFAAGAVHIRDLAAARRRRRRRQVDRRSRARDPTSRSASSAMFWLGQSQRSAARSSSSRPLLR